MVEIITGPWHDVTLRRVVSRLDSWFIILSTVVYEICLAEPDTVLVFGIYLGVFGDGTRLAMPKTIYAPDSSSLSLVQGLLRESWIRGYPDSQTIYFGRTVGL